MSTLTSYDDLDDNDDGDDDKLCLTCKLQAVVCRYAAVL